MSNSMQSLQILLQRFKGVAKSNSIILIYQDSVKVDLLGW